MRKLFVLCLAAVSLMLSAPVLAAPNPAAGSPIARININTANAAELERLPGIGKVTAMQIIKYRTEKGRFAATGDLVKVKGVGPKTLEKIIDQVTVE